MILVIFLKGLIFLILLFALIEFIRGIWRPTFRWDQMDAQMYTPFLTGGDRDIH